MNPLFPVLPEELASLSDDELQALIDEHVSAIEAIRANDPGIIGELTGSQVVEALRAGVEQMRVLRALQDARAEEMQNYDGTVAELAAEALTLAGATTSDESETETDAETEDDGGGEEEAAAEEAVAGDGEEEESVEEEASEGEAAATTTVTASGTVTYRRPPAPAPDRRGSSEQSGAVLRAAAGLPSFNGGQPLTRPELIEALVAAREITTAKQNERTDVVVATARFPYPEERRLDGRNSSLNAQRINVATPVVASGGLCAPFPAFYDLPVVSVADRPVRDALTAFQATRGGVSVPTPLSMADVAAGVGIITAAEDEAGGSPGTKNCVVIDCDPWTDYDISAIYQCVTHGNLNARAWPERVDAVEQLLAAEHAKVAETNLLDLISAGSTATTDAQWYGAVSSLLQGILKAAAAMRSRHRMRAETRLRILLPSSLPEMLLADMIHGQFDRFHPRSFISSILANANVDVSYYMDTETGDNQTYAAQTAGALLGFKTTVVWYLFPAATWLFLDFGELNLGIVRDSILNETNDFQIFRETFEGAARVGVESIKVTSTICADGTYAPAASAETCS